MTAVAMKKMEKKMTQVHFSKKFIQLLDFDTKIFGFKVARILASKLSLKELRPLLLELKRNRVRLVYWQADSRDKKSQIAARTLKGFLASKQVTYLIDLKKITRPIKTTSKIESYQARNIPTTLKNLATQIGVFSRFGVDPKISRKMLAKLYQTWIKNSVKGTAADKVLVLREKNKIVGFTALSSKNGRGDIRLIAVDAKMRGKNLGTNLINGAFKYFIKKRYTKVQVVTQKSNVAACRFYEKNGFRLEKMDNFYHFWL
jgi:dTDP-4-amino-4,6-dideoxy-D-galactose acyltransferase